MSAMNPRSILSLAGLLLVSLALPSCVTNAPAPAPAPYVQHIQPIKGTPEPDRWKLFLEKAEKGEVEEVPDEPEDSEPLGLVTVRRASATHARARTASENFAGHFRPEAKTSYARGAKGKVTDIESLLNGLPSDSEMTNKDPELVKLKNHENHEPRIPLEKRNLTVEAWLYWEGHQTDNDYHLILGDTPELTNKTIFMNAEISGLPSGHPNAQPFTSLRASLKQLIAAKPHKGGAFVKPVPVRITGSLLWDGEHRNPHNVGPKKPVDIRPKKAWEIHPIHDLGF
jgi:hypothetical protein